VTGLNGQNVLFETGIGNFFPPKLKQRFGVYEAGHVLLDSLQALGLQPGDIDVVVLSHLHFDHAGGLLSQWQEGQPHHLVFDQADYLVGAEHWRRALNPHPRDRASFIPELHALLQACGRLHLVDGPHHPLLGDEVTFSFTDGHTPGLMHAQVADLVFAADLIPGSAWVHVPISMGYDRFPEQLIDEKSAFLESVVHHHQRLFFTHDPEYPVAHITQSDGRFTITNPSRQLSEEL
jgi:glyoxylase-like metal-dependent hydrolase (beta-lactamase superfamily II)